MSDNKNHKAGRQTLECKVTLIWTRSEEKQQLCEKMDAGGNGVRQKKKRKTGKKVDGFGERRYGEGWSQRGRLEETFAPW